MSTSDKSKPKPTTRKKKRSAVTAKRFFDLVVLVLGERSSFTANTAVPMKEVQEEVLKRSDLTARERTAHDEKYIRRRIEFAFRNRRATYTKDTKGIPTLTVLVDGKSGQWGLTDDGVEKARDLAAASSLPPEPKSEAPEAEEPEAEEPEAEEPEAEEPEEPEAVEAKAVPEKKEPEAAAQPKKRRGRRTLSTSV